MLLLLLAGCISYGCGDSSIEGEAHGEWCGPLGSYGFLYIDEEMVSVLFTIDDNLDGDLDTADWLLPTWQAHFHTQHLQADHVVPAEGLLASCSRMESEYGSSYLTMPADTAWLEILGESSRAQTGGHSWRMRWDIQCPAFSMYSSGEDIVELLWTSDGYDWELYGVPGDYPVDEEQP